jgi:hypothetical protein
MIRVRQPESDSQLIIMITGMMIVMAAASQPEARRGPLGRGAAALRRETWWPWPGNKLRYYQHCC